MIPKAHIIHWQQFAPWADDAQIEQDLILSRAIVSLFSGDDDPLFVFRGGTSLHKLYLHPASRYSEDIDLVQLAPGPSKELFQFIQGRLEPWLGKATRRLQKKNGIQLHFHFETTSRPTRNMRVKVEVNTREHFQILGLERMRYAVDSPWFQGEADVLTYSLNELLGTKLRALYQRKKGRDLFDLWDALNRTKADPEQIVHCFRVYLEAQNLSVSYKQFRNNLQAKMQEDDFRTDIIPLLRKGIVYDIAEGYELVEERLLRLMK